jgi:hypothetical protein
MLQVRGRIHIADHQVPAVDAAYARLRDRAGARVARREYCSVPAVRKDNAVRRVERLHVANHPVDIATDSGQYYCGRERLPYTHQEVAVGPERGANAVELRRQRAGRGRHISRRVERAEDVEHGEDDGYDQYCPAVSRQVFERALRLAQFFIGRSLPRCLPGS